MLGIIGALLAAVCYGVATVLQALAASRTARSEGIDPRLLLRVLRQWPFLAGLALDALGFVLSLLALRHLALFVVEAILAGNLAVTAVVAARVLRMRLSWREWAAVGAVSLGLLLLVLSAGTESPVHAGRAFHTTVLVATIALLGIGLIGGRLSGEYSSALLGAVAGLAFGVTGVVVRILTDLHPARLLRDPAAYALLLAAAIGFLCYVTALQRGRVTSATGPLVVAETVAPALVGVLALGDTTRHGYVWVGVAGFLVAVAGALALAHFGSLDRPTPAAAGAGAQVV
ncbi:MAG: hypothetical protein M3042_01720 [Actinomycetota bacterium]|nr:hypothetical protein [Actinomycetota bacterium]